METSVQLSGNRAREWRAMLADHWPEYLIEAWGLGLFMISAGLFGVLFEYPGSPVHQAIPDPRIRRALMGVAMGATAIGIIYSPWGQRSGAHLNPAVTLTFWRLGKVKGFDALWYILAQFSGGALGVLLVWALLGSRFAEPPVHFVATLPGTAGPYVALLAEIVIAAGLMIAVLWISNTTRIMRLTGVVAGMLVASYITLEAPLSGMSMNPARSFASALPSGLWHDLWIYFVAPPLGMFLGAALYVRLRANAVIECAKLDHAPSQRCIHCGYVPPSFARALRGI